MEKVNMTIFRFVFFKFFRSIFLDLLIAFALIYWKKVNCYFCFEQLHFATDQTEIKFPL